MNKSERLLQHSLWLMAATFIGHAGNYLFHMISGRMLPDQEYGLMMSLFGVIHLVILPMSALGLALTRAVGSAEQGFGLSALFKKWFQLILMVSLAACAGVYIASPWIQSQLGINRFAPILLATLIPCMSLLLTLTGAGLRGMQYFSLLAIQGSLMFGVRALVVGFCLHLGFRAAGWALLAHLTGMLTALVFSCWMLRRKTSALPDLSEGSAPSVTKEAFAAVPVLIGFAVLMSADVVLARMWFPKDLSGQFAQAATLGRMILWLPIPVAQAMFPKVVRQEITTSEHRKTALRAFGYTLGLLLIAVIGCWTLAPLGLRLVFGIQQASADQITWLRWTALAMTPLAPLYLLMNYEIARGKVRRLLPICAGAGLFLVLVAIRHTHLIDLPKSLLIATSLTLLGCTTALLSNKRFSASLRT